MEKAMLKYKEDWNKLRNSLKGVYTSYMEKKNALQDITIKYQSLLRELERPIDTTLIEKDNSISLETPQQDPMPLRKSSYETLLFKLQDDTIRDTQVSKLTDKARSDKANFGTSKVLSPVETMIEEDCRFEISQIKSPNAQQPVMQEKTRKSADNLLFKIAESDTSKSFIPDVSRSICSTEDKENLFKRPSLPSWKAGKAESKPKPVGKPKQTPTDVPDDGCSQQ
ncbi:hypothetical protein Ciccas_010283 [Cichlidogyrus casuarinus]|uniref:Uncharacterized protein n=1 Tax=Cichlidogyrus casuarinus TaxID=1844966 RepID=A0ABD2PUJ6_9PLAT